MKNMISIAQLEELMNILEPEMGYTEFLDTYHGLLTITDDMFFCHEDDVIEKFNGEYTVYELRNGDIGVSLI